MKNLQLRGKEKEEHKMITGIMERSRQMVRGGQRHNCGAEEKSNPNGDDGGKRGTSCD